MIERIYNLDNLSDNHLYLFVGTIADGSFVIGIYRLDKEVCEISRHIALKNINSDSVTNISTDILDINPQFTCYQASEDIAEEDVFQSVMCGDIPSCASVALTRYLQELNE